MELNINNHAILKIGSIEVWITDTQIFTWVIMGVLITLAVIVRIKLKNFKSVPKGFQNVIEMLVEVFDNYLRTTAGDKLMFLGNWFFTAFGFILISNLSGLIPTFRSPTADWSMTVMLALGTFFMIQVLAFRYRKGQYLKTFFEPVFIFLPMNIISEIARPISLSFRLFGNMLSGLVMMSLVYTMFPPLLKFVIPAALHVYFDLFAGVLQTYIFCTLSMSFIGSASELPEE